MPNVQPSSVAFLVLLIFVQVIIVGFLTNLLRSFA